jgi:hypothetical protein
VPPERRKQFFTFATVVAVINSVVGGSAIAIALGAIADTSLGVAAGVGGVAALVSLVALLRYADRLLEERAGSTEFDLPFAAVASDNCSADRAPLAATSWVSPSVSGNGAIAPPGLPGRLPTIRCAFPSRVGRRAWGRA